MNVNDTMCNNQGKATMHVTIKHVEYRVSMGGKGRANQSRRKRVMTWPKATMGHQRVTQMRTHQSQVLSFPVRYNKSKKRKCVVR